MAQRKPCPSNYLKTREAFMVARGVHAGLHNELMQALGVKSEAALSLALLEVDSDHPLVELVAKWQQAEASLDQAEKAFDAARADVAQRIIQADLASLEC